MINYQPQINHFLNRLTPLLSVIFTVIIVIYSAAGPLNDFVKWFIEFTTPAFDELSRRDQRVLLKTHWLGALWRSFQQSFLLPTGLTLGLPLVFCFAITLANFKETGVKKLLHWLAAIITIFVLIQWIINLSLIDGGLIPSTKSGDIVIFLSLVLILLYITYRLYGTFIVGFCVFWIVYFFVKGLLPEWTGVFAGADASFQQNFRAMVLNFWSQTGGMFGRPLQVVTGNVLIFIVFGSVLMASGAGTLLMKIANRLTGGFTGGAAHGAIASSALFGTVSGAAISNVVSTGVMTIPVIKKSGFKPNFAGAVEAAASTGGQIMPPVLGVVAFFVAGQIGLEYRYIVIAAIIPAIFYYMSVFLTVYFEARKQNIGALPASERPKLNKNEKIQCFVFIIPLTVLSYFLFSQPSVPKAGFYGFISALISTLILFPESRSIKNLYGAFAGAGKIAASITVIVATIGLVVGLIQISGFSGRLSLLLTILASGPLLTVLIVVALGSIVLGMGLPPGATYFIIVIALSSGIEAVSLAPLTLHLFVVFFAVMSTVTPPVALAAFAAAPIAGGSPIKTGFEAARLAVGGFIIPFVFVYHPAVLYKLQILFEWFGEETLESKAMIDIHSVTWVQLGWVMIAYSLAIWLISSALIGYEKYRLHHIERIIRPILGVCVLLPLYHYAIPAFLLGITLIATHRLQLLKRFR